MGVKGIVGLVLGGLAIVLVIYGGFSRTWWYAPDETVHTGPPGVTVCEGGVCKSQSWDGVDGGDPAWKRWIALATATRWSATLAGATLAVAMMLRLRLGRRSRRAPGIAAAAGCAAFLLVTAAYVAFAPEKAVAGATLGQGLWAAFAGGVLGAIGGVLLAARPPIRPSASAPRAPG